jgi:hypothetical protein
VTSFHAAGSLTPAPISKLHSNGFPSLDDVFKLVLFRKGTKKMDTDADMGNICTFEGFKPLM